jgi:hypothetical protein
LLQLFVLIGVLLPPTAGLHAFGATPGDRGQSRYLVGDVAVAVIFPESDGTIDPNRETWAAGRIDACMDEVAAALDWWEIQEPRANLDFHIHSYGAQTTGYEPITRTPDDEGLWIAQIMGKMGYKSGTTYFDQVAALNSYEMSRQGADWAYTIFVVDSYNDADGRFSDSWFAYSYVGGPFLVMAYDNGEYGLGRMHLVCAHETGHIFGANDEYDSRSERDSPSGARYDQEPACIMESCSSDAIVCPATRAQIGWKDEDCDNVLDPTDTAPNTAPNSTDLIGTVVNGLRWTD